MKKLIGFIMLALSALPAVAAEVQVDKCLLKNPALYANNIRLNNAKYNMGEVFCRIENLELVSTRIDSGIISELDVLIDGEPVTISLTQGLISGTYEIRMIDGIALRSNSFEAMLAQGVQPK